MMRLTVVVTDGRDRPVAGLQASDFELMVDGLPQGIERAEFKGDAAATPRLFAFLLDEYHTTPGDSAAVRERLQRFVHEQLRDGDRAVVVRPLDPLTGIRPIADRDSLASAIAAFEGRKGDYAPRTAFERNYMAQAPDAVAAGRAQIVSSALRAVATSLGAAAGARAAIVLVSDGFPRVRVGRDVPAGLDTATRMVLRADAPVYAFAPGLRVAVGEGTAGAGHDAALAALRELTTQTGGELFAGTGTLDTGLRRVVRDLDSHYVLAYRTAHGSDGRFHAVQVSVKRKGTQVRSPAGYLAPAPEAVRGLSSAASGAPLRVLRRSSLIQSWSGAVPSGPDRVRLTITWNAAAPLPAAPARRRAATVVITASAADGTVLFDGGVGPVGEAPSPGVPDHAAFEAPAGPVRVDMKILDAQGVVIDTDARDISVPTAAAGRAVIYPPAIIRTRSAREFREAVDDLAAPPVPTRQFWRTDRLLIRVAASDAAGGIAPVTAALLNRWRQPMRTVPAIESRPAPDITQFDLPLAALPPGEYTLQLTTSGSAGTVTEHVTFRVQG